MYKNILLTLDKEELEALREMFNSIEPHTDVEHRVYNDLLDDINYQLDSLEGAS